METIQMVIGGIVTLIVVTISLVVAYNTATNNQRYSPPSAVTGTCVFFGMLILSYIILAIVGGVLWVIAWIGVMLREILMWLIEAVFWFL